MVVMRHGASGAAQFLAERIESNVINAGDGTHEHPTQGLLDLLTLRDHFGDLRGLRVCIVGDVLHSRVARSNIWGLQKMGAEVAVCGPRSLLPERDRRVRHHRLRPGRSGDGVGAGAQRAALCSSSA